MSLLKLMSACRAGGVVISSVATEKITPEFISHLVSGDYNLNMVKNTTRNYLICDAFSATFSENVTNVHCNPKHCDDFFNSSRFYDVFLFFVTDVH
jgi:hypothetical protein